jgi:phage-related protein
LSVAGNRFWEALTSKLSPAISFVTDALTGLVNMVTRLLNGIGLVVDVFSAIGEAKSMVLNWGKNNVLDWLGKQFTNSGSSSTPSGTAQATVPTPSMATQAISPSAPPLPSSVQNKSVSTTVNMKNDFNIDGSQNPKATGAAINRELQRSWSDTYYQSPAYQGVNY